MVYIYESDTNHIHEHNIHFETDKIDPMIKVVFHQILDQNPHIKPKHIRVLLITNLNKYPTLKNSIIPDFQGSFKDLIIEIGNNINRLTI